jgi:hypothetical protein
MSRMDEYLAQWLFDNGGPVVRYRTARELLAEPPADMERLRSELLASPMVRLWLERLKGCTKLHDSGNDRFENIVGKLLEFGLTAELEEVRQLLLPFLCHLDRGPSHKHGMGYMIGAMIVASGLARAGIDDAQLSAFMHERLDRLCENAIKERYDIYVKGISFPDMPAAYRDRYPVLKEEFTPNGELLLPNIHDVYMLSALQDAAPPADVTTKIEQVIAYILNPEYQALDPSFGYVREMHKDGVHYYVLGWAAQLPGYNAPLKKGKPPMLLQRLELICHFPAACRHEWVLRSLEYLDQYKTKAGTWSFPREYLTEKPVGYWVAGAHMGLEEDRRSKISIEVESTFRMLKVRSLMRKALRRI